MSTPHTVLIVDDDPNTREGLQRALKRDYSVQTAESAEVALDILSGTHVDVMLTDLRMPGMDGMALLRRTLAQSDPPLVVLLTAYGNVETAVEAMKHGAYDFLMKPVNLDRLEILLARALHTRAVETENEQLHERLNERYGVESMISHAPAMREVFEVIQQAAPSQATVLIQGESGTGKELVAHAIHQLSTRSRGPFVAVHCAALSAPLLESELFGHEKGSFTGANERRRGRFEMADGGTLFLDEISEIEPSVQIKLLRVLETRQVERVGGNVPIDVDIRIVVATNKDLKAQVEAGAFREDLYYRLDVINVDLPALRERHGDVPLLCRHFLEEFSVRNEKKLLEFTAETLNILTAYTWPGNVRELRNTIEKMVVLARGDRLTPRDVPAAVRNAVDGGEHNVPRRRSAAIDPISLDANERSMIYSAIERNGGNKSKAALELGVSRRTLHRKLKRYEEEESGAPPHQA